MEGGRFVGIVDVFVAEFANVEFAVAFVALVRVEDEPFAFLSRYLIYVLPSLDCPYLSSFEFQLAFDSKEFFSNRP